MHLPDHFDLVARYYDRLMGAADAPALACLGTLPSGARVVDVGGGTGRVAQTLAARGVRVVVCDRSLGMLSQAHAKGLVTVRGDAGRLPFPSGSADGLLIVDAFHHFVNPAPAVAQPRAAAQMLRVLRPGGNVVILEPDIRRLPARLVAYAEALLLMGSRFLSPPEMVALFEGYGAETVGVHERGFSVCLVFRKAQEDGGSLP